MKTIIILRISLMIGGWTTTLLADSGQHKYEVKVQNDGRTFTEEIKASSSFDARHIIQDRYPKAVILDVKEIKEK